MPVPIALDATGIGHGESSAVLRCLPTPSKAEPRAFARRCEPQTRAPTRGRAGVSCVEHVYESPGMVRLCGAAALDATGIGHSERSAVLRCLPTPF